MSLIIIAGIVFLAFLAAVMAGCLITVLLMGFGAIAHVLQLAAVKFATPVFRKVSSERLPVIGLLLCILFACVGFTWGKMEIPQSYQFQGVLNPS